MSPVALKEISAIVATNCLRLIEWWIKPDEISVLSGVLQGWNLKGVYYGMECTWNDQDIGTRTYLGCDEKNAMKLG